jgi:PAP2 superfamily protein
MEGRAQAGAAVFARCRASLLASARRDRALYAIALTALATGFALQPVTGNRPDWAIVLNLCGSLALGVLPCGVCGLALARSRAPLRDMARWALSLLRDDALAANVIHTLTLFFLFGTGFAVLKGAIAVITPFAWDAVLADLDRALHFGRYPHEWLRPLLAWHWVVWAVNFAYNLWFLVVISCFLACAGAVRNQRVRHQYLMSFMLVWFVGGFLIATGFSSAGPAYYARIGLGDVYAPLMDALHAAAEQYPLWALKAQEILWQGFTGARPVSAGISAFPSMHVATATLLVLAARRVHPWLLPVGIAYWCLIGLGSVLLGWHYAVDGYAGTLIALLGWWTAGLYGRRVPVAEPAPLEA